jgi:hypothetical protein
LVINSETMSSTTSARPANPHSHRTCRECRRAHGTTGPFVILQFPEPTDRAVVYVETLAGDIYLEEHADVDRYTLAFDRLLAAALHPDDSVRLIERAAAEMT